MPQSKPQNNTSTMGPGQLVKHIQRLGQSYVGNRLMLQAHHSAKVYGGRGRLRLHQENSQTLPLEIGGQRIWIAGVDPPFLPCQRYPRGHAEYSAQVL